MTIRMIVSAAALALGFAASGCNQTTGAAVAEKQEPAKPPEQAKQANSDALPPPTLPNVVKDVREADAGKTISLKVGERFTISLVGVPTAGYVWTPETVPAFLVKKDEATGATIKQQNQPGYAGGNHWEVTAFEATAAGSGELELVQKRPWEKQPDPDNQHFRITVTVK